MKDNHIFEGGVIVATRLSRVGQRRQVVIPKEVYDKLGLTEGDFVEFQHRNGEVVIKAKKLVDADDVLTPEEEKLVRKGEAEIARGHFKSLKQVKHDLGL
jgi:AbrB family looped-hinge helix DNA binding protein